MNQFNRSILYCALACALFLSALTSRAQCGSPIILDLDDNGFDLTGLLNSVQFDMDSDGFPNELGWTSAGTRDAFLALDRNRNGQIDNGAELFGNQTPLSIGHKADNGFVALAEFDRPALGGNGDRRITAKDAIWVSLLVWVDSNHNGRSEANELESLDRAGVVRLETRYHLSRRKDRHGNLFRFVSKAWHEDKKGKVRPQKVYDVFFVEK